MVDSKEISLNTDVDQNENTLKRVWSLRNATSFSVVTTLFFIVFFLAAMFCPSGWLREIFNALWTGSLIVAISALRDYFTKMPLAEEVSQRLLDTLYGVHDTVAIQSHIRDIKPDKRKNFMDKTIAVFVDEKAEFSREEYRDIYNQYVQNVLWSSLGVGESAFFPKAIRTDIDCTFFISDNNQGNTKPSNCFLIEENISYNKICFLRTGSEYLSSNDTNTRGRFNEKNCDDVESVSIAFVLKRKDRDDPSVRGCEYVELAELTKSMKENFCRLAKGAPIRQGTNTQNTQQELQKIFNEAFGTPRITVSQHYLKEHSGDNIELFGTLKKVTVNLEENNSRIKSIIAEYSFKKKLPYPSRGIEIKFTIPRLLGDIIEVNFVEPSRGVQIWMNDHNKKYRIETALFLNGIHKSVPDIYDEGGRIHVQYESWIHPRHGAVFSINKRKGNEAP